MSLFPRPSLPSSLSPVYSYGAYATFPLFMRLIFHITRDWYSNIMIDWYSNIMIDWYSILREIDIPTLWEIDIPTLWEIALVFQLHACRLYLLSVDIDGRCFYSLDALYSPVHLYPLRYRRSILTARMRPSLFLCVWFQHYERLHFNITRDCVSISITRLPSIFTIGWYWRRMFLFTRPTLLPRTSLPSSLSLVYSYGAYATFPLPLLPYIY